MSANPSAIVRLYNEFKAQAPESDDIVLGGIYAAKSGYHNTRANHLAGRNGGSPSDYSIQASADKLGPSDKAAALDITFNTARRSDFRVIAKYSKRLYDAFRNRDPRLFYNGKAVVREFFGNIDLDRTVEGWSLYRNRAATSDDSHLWHIHISFHRQFVENWDALKGVLDVLLARPIPKPPVQNGDDDVALTQEDIEKVAQRAADLVWFERITNPLAPAGTTPPHASTYLVGQGNEIDNIKSDLATQRNTLNELLAKVNELLARGEGV